MAAHQRRAEPQGPGRPARWGRRLLFMFLGLLGVVVLAAAALIAVVGTEPGTRWVAGHALRLADEREDLAVRVDRIDGTLLDTLTVSGVALSDATGPWLEVGLLSVAWRPYRLLLGDLWIDELTVADLTVIRPPDMGEPAEEEADDDGEPWQLPEPDLQATPLERVTVRAITLERIHLGEAVLGDAVSFRAEGRVLGTALGGVDARLQAERLDAPGSGSATLRYRPGGILGLHLAAFEPEGGAVARLLDLPGLPAVRMALNGEAPASDWSGALFVEAEDLVSIDADIEVSLARVRTVSVNGWAQPGSLAPVEVVTVTGDELAFAATLSQQPQGALVAEGVRARGRGWVLEGEGRLEPGADAVSAHAVLEIAEGWAVEELAGIPLGSGRVEARVEGPFDRLEVHLDAVARDTLVREVSVQAQTTLGEEIPFRAEGRVDGAGEALPQAAAIVDGGLDFSVVGTFRPTNSDISVETLTMRTPQANAAYVGTINLDPLMVAGRLNASMANLAILEPLIGVPVRGGGTVMADLRAAEDAVSGEVRVGLREFATGIAQADALLGGDVDVRSTVDWSNDVVRLRDLSLRAPGAVLDGGVALRGFEDIAGSFVLGLPSLDRLDVGAEGIARVDARIGGTLVAPRLDVTVSGRDVRYAGLDIAEPRVEAVVTGQRLDIGSLAATVAGASVRGTLAVPFDTGLLDGRFELDLESPEALAAVTGQPVTGDLRAEVALRPEAAGQGLTLRLDGQSVALPQAGVAVSRVQVRAVLSDLFGAPDGRVEVTAGAGGAGAVTWSALDGTADLRDGGGAFSVLMQGDGLADYEARVSGGVSLAEATAVRLETLSVVGQDHAVRLLEPTTVTLEGGGYALTPARLSIDGGSAVFGGRLADGRIDLDMDIRALPLQVLEIVQPDYPARGTVDAQVRLSGPVGGPQGQVSVRTSPITLPEAAVEGLVIQADATLGGGRLTGEARVSGVAPQPAVITMDVPLVFSDIAVPSIPETQPLSITADWQGPVQAIWALVPQVGHRLAGQAAIQGRMSGTLAAPDFAGEATIRNGSYENMEWGTVLRDLSLTAGLTGGGLVTMDGTATDGGSGRVTLRGSLDTAPETDTAVDVSVTLNQVQVVRRDDLRAGISGDLSYVGTLAAGTLRGDLRTETVRLAVGADLGGGIPELDVVEVNRAALGQPEEIRDVVENGAGFGQAIALAITLRMPNRVYVAGQGLDSEWQGELRVSGTAAAPSVEGGLNVVRGSFSAIGRTFVLERGEVNFTGGGEVNPEVTVRAVHEANAVTAIVLVSGPVQDLDIELTSRPALPQDEIIARVLFDRPLGELGAGEAISVAQAAARLSGLGGGGPGILEGLRGAFALDVLNIGGGEGGPTIEAGRYIGDNIYVGVEQGAGSDSASVEVEVELTPNVTIGTRGSASSGADIGIQWKFDY